jgi:hypothetical protein
MPTVTHSCDEEECQESERLVTTASVTPKTTNSNSVLPNTALNDIQQHVNNANSGVYQYIYISTSIELIIYFLNYMK